MLYKVPLWKRMPALENRVFSESELLLQKIKSNKLKRVDKRLSVVKLYLDGLTHQEIADKIGFSREWVTKLINTYKKQGLEEFSRHKYGGNNRALSVSEEGEILAQFETDAAKGKLVIANTIKAALDKKRNKITCKSYVYALLARHKARKIMPRPGHPKKASEAEIEASKKLTFGSGSL